MIRRIELQHKIKFFEKEYFVELYNDSDFATAFKTLQYPSGVMADTETPLIAIDEDAYSHIFIENGDRVVHYYSDEDNTSEKRIEFIEDIFSKYNEKTIFIFLVTTNNATLSKISDILNDLGRYGEIACVSVITDSKIKKDSVRIVIGT